MAGQRIQLSVVNGAMEGVTAEFPPKKKITIGRTKINAFQIKHDTVSQRHAFLVNKDGRWMLTDADSSNGTFLNGVAAEPNSPVEVKDGDLVKIGPINEVRFTICAAEDGEPATGQGKLKNDIPRPAAAIRKANSEIPPREASAGKLSNEIPPLEAATRKVNNEIPPREAAARKINKEIPLREAATRKVNNEIPPHEAATGKANNDIQPPEAAKGLVRQEKEKAPKIMTLPDWYEECKRYLVEVNTKRSEDTIKGLVEHAEALKKKLTRA